MATYQDLANLIFPDVTETIEDLEKRYPARNLKEGARVTRFAPSPTGFLHTGSLFTSMIAYKMAKDSGGVFYVRLEDTDTKREVEGSGLDLLKQLKVFGIVPDEGYYGDHEEGNYGPYQQSHREKIYRIVIKHLVEKGLAYPCFCSPKDLDALRAVQEKCKVIPGYYGMYAKCRGLSVDQAIERIQRGDAYVIRFRSSGNHLHKIKVHDLIRGTIEIAENDQDIVILKGDGLPTYHFAHAVDDHFMHTNCVTRGEEWIASLPIHVELFQTLGFEAPEYAHLPVIMKLDNGNKRKLSKRKDLEAAVSYFLQDGYPAESLLQYLMTIANSNYEEWQIENKDKTFHDFHLSFEKFSLDGALFDIQKLQYIAKEQLSKMTKKEITDRAYAWAKLYSPELQAWIEKDRAKVEEILNIEREKENPRKDYAKYSDIYPAVRFFDSDVYHSMLHADLPWNAFQEKSRIVEVLCDLAENMNYEGDESTWFASLKEIGGKHGYAESNKIYKQNKESYFGHAGDVAEMLRIALTTNKQSPNLYSVIRILGKEEVKRRIQAAIDISLK